MNPLPEPDDVDLVIGDVEPGSHDAPDITSVIAEIKRRPEYRAKLAEADKIFASLGIDRRNGGAKAAEILLEQWRQCVTELTAADESQAAHANGARVEQAED